MLLIVAVGVCRDTGMRSTKLKARSIVSLDHMIHSLDHMISVRLLVRG